jgi:hypothetical protein
MKNHQRETRKPMPENKGDKTLICRKNDSFDIENLK